MQFIGSYGSLFADYCRRHHPCCSSSYHCNTFHSSMRNKSYAFLTASAIIFAIFLSKGLGIIISGLGKFTYFAKASAAAILCLSSTCGILASSIHLNIPGKTRRLFIWFGKSLLQVATIYAHHAFASSGNISGVGFAIAKTIDFSFIVAISSLFRRFGALTQINISAHGRTCLSVQL